MPNDPVARLLAVKVRDAEKAMLRARDSYSVAAAKLIHLEALAALENYSKGEYRD
jgi:hypothetical protein